MATEFLREKINVLNNMIQQTALEHFQVSLVIKIAATSTGDAQIDQNFHAAASNAKTQMMACERRLEVYRQELAQLSAELGD
jgi:uncharacterized protein (UPF0216 family)